MRNLFRFAINEEGKIAIDWAVLLASVVSLSIAATLALTHNAQPSLQHLDGPIIITKSVD